MDSLLEVERRLELDVSCCSVDPGQGLPNCLDLDLMLDTEKDYIILAWILGSVIFLVEFA